MLYIIYIITLVTGPFTRGTISPAMVMEGLGVWCGGGSSGQLSSIVLDPGLRYLSPLCYLTPLLIDLGHLGIQC